MLEVSPTIRIGADSKCVALWDLHTPTKPNKDGVIPPPYWEATRWYGSVEQALRAVNEQWARELIDGPVILGWRDFISMMSLRWEAVSLNFTRDEDTPRKPRER